MTKSHAWITDEYPPVVWRRREVIVVYVEDDVALVLPTPATMAVDGVPISFWIETRYLQREPPD